MYISLNYLIFVFSIIFSYDLIRRGKLYKDSAAHMLLLSLSALFGGFCHHLYLEKDLVIEFINNFNMRVPMYYEINNIRILVAKTWLVTYLFIGLTEYYFMRLFLIPVAHYLKYYWIEPVLKLSLGIYFIFAILLDDYSLVVTYHLFTHTLVLIFAFFAIYKKSIYELWHLVFLIVFNLLAGLIWSLMALGEIPSGFLHYNDWYHILIIIFIIYLHWAATKGRLVEALDKL